jgi:hypothetical protein
MIGLEVGYPWDMNQNPPVHVRMCWRVWWLSQIPQQLGTWRKRLGQSKTTTASADVKELFSAKLPNQWLHGRGRVLPGTKTPQQQPMWKKRLRFWHIWPKFIDESAYGSLCRYKKFREHGRMVCQCEILARCLNQNNQRGNVMVGEVERLEQTLR